MIIECDGCDAVDVVQAEDLDRRNRWSDAEAVTLDHGLEVVVLEEKSEAEVMIFFYFVTDEEVI